VTKVELRGTAEPKPPAETKNQPTPLKHGSLDLRIHGSNTIGAKLAPEIARAYAEKNGLSAGTTNMGASSRTSTSTTAPPKATANISSGLRRTAPRRHFRICWRRNRHWHVLRRIKDEEVKLLKDAGLGDLKAPKAKRDSARRRGRDREQGNPVESLSLDQIAAFFRGNPGLGPSWRQPGLIVTYSRDKKSGTFDTFKSLVMEEPPRERWRLPRTIRIERRTFRFGRSRSRRHWVYWPCYVAARKQSAFQRVVTSLRP